MTSDADGYVTKFNADGSYAWTATLTGRGSIHLTGLAVTPAGGVVAVGDYQDTIDLDPGPGSSAHFTFTADQTDAFAVELGANGMFAWGGTFASAADSVVSAAAVTVDGAGAVYVSGGFFGTVNFDPGAGTHNLVGNQAGFVVKLTSGGAFAWASSFDDGTSCFAILSSAAVAKDGTLWAIGEVNASPDCTLAPDPHGCV